MAQNYALTYVWLLMINWISRIYFFVYVHAKRDRAKNNLLYMAKTDDDLRENFTASSHGEANVTEMTMIIRVFRSLYFSQSQLLDINSHIRFLPLQYFDNAMPAVAASCPSKILETEISYISSNIFYLFPLLPSHWF